MTQAAIESKDKATEKQTEKTAPQTADGGAAAALHGDAYGGMAISADNPFGGGAFNSGGGIDAFRPNPWSDERMEREQRYKRAWDNLSVSEGIGKDQLIPGLRDHNMEVKDAREARQWLTDHFVSVGGYDKAIDSTELLRACETLTFADGSKVSEKDLKMMNKILQQFYTIANADSMIFRDKEISMGDVSALYKVGR
jgi:hypothetical protein